MNLTDLFAGNDTTDGIDSKLDAQKAIEKLGHIDRAILYLYVTGHTQQEIGDILGYSRGKSSIGPSNPPDLCMDYRNAQRAS